MASFKALAAIGLTLCLIIPIGLGYVLSIEEEPVTSWQTTSQSSISDLILNNQAPYFGSYKGASNNSTLLGTGTAAPEYISVTGNYSALPIYDETAVMVTDNAPSTTYTRENGRDKAVMPISQPVSGDIDAVIVGNHDLYRVGTIALLMTYPDSTTEIQFSTEYWTIYRDSASTWTALNDDGRKYTGVSNWMAGTSSGSGGLETAVVISYADYVNVTHNLAPASLPLITSAIKVGSNYYGGNHNLRLTSDTVYLDGDELSFDFANNSIQVASTVRNDAITTAPTGQYADPSDGWTAVDTSTNYTWVNNQLNQSVTFYVKPIHAPGQYATIGDLRIYAAGQNIEAYLLSQGPQTAQVLGAYDYLQVVVSTTGYIVSGLSAWPTMGTAPTLYNTLTFDKSSALFDALLIQTTHQGSNYWHFRVDNANIVQGYYPDTLDYTLNLDQLYPGAAVDVYINSIGLYGDSLSIGGINYAVDQSTGSITVNGAPARLLHAHLSAWQTDGGYSVRINGVEIATTQTLPQIYFGGEWSLTATAYKMEPVEDMQLTWHAGEFSLDKDSFAAAVVITAVLMILVLGMTGGRSMSKMGLLILVCGGAALVAMIML